MNHQDWEPIIIKKNTTADATEKKHHQKQGTGQNINDDDEVPKVRFIDKDFSNQVEKARLAKGWTRKQLAQNMMIAETIVTEVETGKAVYNGNIVNKFKTYLGINKNTPK
jgi:ribosome-binding protein aMBF1 (putative translation factor)